MDRRAIKRLLIIVVASLIAIALLKMGLLKTYTTLNKVAAEKKQVAASRPVSPQQAPTPPSASEIAEIPAASTAIETTTADTPASASVGEAR